MNFVIFERVQCHSAVGVYGGRLVFCLYVFRALSIANCSAWLLAHLLFSLYCKLVTSVPVLAVMHEILKPFLLRRVKVDVALNIPPKKELLVYAPMSPVQLELYRATVEHNYNKLLMKTEKSVIIQDQTDGKRAKCKCRTTKKDLFDSGENEDEFDGQSNASSDFDVVIEDKEDKDYRIMLKMTNPTMQLRKIVNHPYLVHFPVVPGKNKLRVDEELVRKSGKLLVLDAMLVKLKQRGHKVL
jgi:ATP-dependent DNA helicase